VRITFTPASETAQKYFDSPQSASRHVPEWFKSMPLHMNGEKDYGMTANGKGPTNLTLKGCSPFLDALTTGYVITTQFDIEVRKQPDGSISFNWAADAPGYLSIHSPDQTVGLPVPMGAFPGAYKWNPQWQIKTPSGYSTMFTHPLNRDELPFKVMSGVVDTDSYTLPVQFPFRMLEFDKDILIIPKGTPIVQVFPFKREDWTAKVEKFSQEELDKKNFTLYSRIIRSYKTQFWKKKTYN